MSFGFFPTGLLSVLKTLILRPKATLGFKIKPVAESAYTTANYTNKINKSSVNGELIPI